MCLACGVALAQRPNQGEDESATFVREGRAALRRGELDDAARALDQALALNPRRVEAYVLRSAVYAARKQYKAGIALMRKAQQLAPDDAEVLTALGTHLVLAGDTGAGVPLLEQVVAAEPARYDAQLLLGHHWHATGKWPAAITALEAYFAHRPKELAREDARNQIELADAYLRFREPQKALALFEVAARTRKADLRARMGIAWATAALDCKKARPLLRELEPVAALHPEVWLVDGQCALALGDAQGALALGRRYLERSPNSTAAGHALVGEAHAARGQLAEARKALETARSLEPARRRWTVRLAYVLRRANQHDDALAALERLGPPANAAIDADWWVELGEVLLAKGDAPKAVARLAPVIGDLANHAPAHTVLGAAQLAAGQPEPAIESLELAEAVQTTARSRKLLAGALASVAATKLAAGDAAAAEPLLVRADQLDRDALVLRNLGIAKLALDKPADAVEILDRSVQLDPAPIALMLAARAHALVGDVARARPLYERALAADKDNVEIAIDWAASELAAGDPALAVAALERTASAARGGPLAARHKAALASARHAAGLAQLRAGNATKAVELLRAAALVGDATLARKCDLAVALAVAGEAQAALSALKGQNCPAQLLDTVSRVAALHAAQDAYKAGQLAQARKYLATARTANARVGADEVAHNLAVLDLADGRIDAAIAALDKLASRVPEALVNLGIAFERKGDHARALDAWKRARKAGVRFASLAEWIETKERIYGEEAR